MSKGPKETRLPGRTISPGSVVGTAFVYRERLESLAESYAIPEEEVADELRRIDEAFETVAADLRVSARRIEGETNTRLSKIFEAHEAILLDPALRKEIRDLVRKELIGASHALARVFRGWERKFERKSEQVHQQHAHDIADLRVRVLREMAGVKTTSLEKMPAGRVLIARRLLPSDTVALPRGAVAGIVVEFGGQGSHAALLAEALGIPTVAQVQNATQLIADDDRLIVDGVRGQVILHPAEATLKRYEREIKTAHLHGVQAKAEAREAVRTSDGTAVGVWANVGCAADVLAAVDHGADGVGLCRIEQLYLSHKSPPTAAELLAELRTMFAPMGEKPITVRLLDLGGDKPLPFLRLPPEDNPFLGQRGVRFLRQFPDLLTEQLTALAKFAREADLRILVPLVTLAEDMVFVRERLAAAAHGKTPPLGAMIETPAAALNLQDIATHADFLSIGTNDLTQYTMAAGRENPLVNDYFREDHPAVMRLVKIVAQEAGARPVAVCGELARITDVIPALLKMGIRLLSVAPPLVPQVKAAIKNASLI